MHFSASDSGRNIKVDTSLTSVSGTLIHTATSLSTAFDQVYLYAGTVATTECKLTLLFGGTASTADHIVRTLQPNNGEELLISGRPLNKGVAVRAYASTASMVNIGGFVIRVTSE